MRQSCKHLINFFNFEEMLSLREQGLADETSWKENRQNDIFLNLTAWWTCNYGNLKDELLRDRLVVGIRDQELSKKLQLDPDLTLEKTKKTIRQKEAVKEQHYILQGNDTKDPTLEEVRYGKWHRKPPRPEVRPQYIQGDTYSKCMNRADNSLCTRCGCSKHYRGEMWSASSARCHRCDKRGHYSALLFKESLCQC